MATARTSGSRLADRRGDLDRIALLDRLRQGAQGVRQPPERVGGFLHGVVDLLRREQLIGRRHPDLREQQAHLAAAEALLERRQGPPGLQDQGLQRRGHGCAPNLIRGLSLAPQATSA